jgi:hypothetical protein
LAKRLAHEAEGRAPDDLLLTRSDGQSWGENASVNYRVDFAAIVAACGLDPKITVYSLRHSSIVRCLLAGIPARVVCARHDTGLASLERNYSRFISEHADQYARQGLLLRAPAATDSHE